MDTYMLFGKYSPEALKGMCPERTKKAISLIEKHGGKVKCMYALLGQEDLVLIVDLPGVESAMEVSLALYKLTGISFQTSLAVEIEKFDQLIKNV